VHISVDVPVRELSVELQQEVEIARAISSRARLLILDEATSSLSEPRVLQEQVARARVSGFAVEMEETTAGFASVAVPVHGDSGRVVAALSVTAPSFRRPSRWVAGPNDTHARDAVAAPSRSARPR
jgi:DNA-binding IclR family transcriptional regulator